MTEQNSFVADNTTDNKDTKETSFNQEQQNPDVDKKSVEGQLAILQKRLDDQLGFIDTLKGENKSLREQQESTGKIDELLLKLDASQIEDTGRTQQTNSPMNIDDLRDLGVVTKQDLEQQRTDSIHADNFSKVKSALIDTYGEEKYLDVLTGKASTLGMSIEDIDRLSRSNPAATIKLLEADKVTNASTSTQSSFNTQAIDTHNNAQASTPTKGVMYGSTTKDVLTNWRAAGEVVKKNMEQGNRFG